jgi:hypothetical protein
MKNKKEKFEKEEEVLWKSLSFIRLASSYSNRNNSLELLLPHTEISFPFPLLSCTSVGNLDKPRRRHKKHRRDISCFVYIISCHIPSRIKKRQREIKSRKRRRWRCWKKDEEDGVKIEKKKNEKRKTTLAFSLHLPTHNTSACVSSLALLSLSCFDSSLIENICVLFNVLLILYFHHRSRTSYTNQIEN